MEHIKEYIKNNRRKLLILGMILVIMSIAFIFTKHNYSLYESPIIKVTEVNETEYYEFGKENPFYIQEITATVMNGDLKGETVHFENRRTTSGLSCFDIRESDSVIVNLNSDGTVNSVDNIKRDHYVVLLIGIFCIALYAISTKQSGPVLFATILNLGVFVVVLLLRPQFDIFILFIFGTILFTVITLFITAGFNKKSLYAVLSTLISVTIMIMLAMIVLKINETFIAFEAVDYVDYLYDYKSVFYSGVLISGLGAIMDTSIIMATSINELIEKDPQIDTKALKKSAWEIAQDITGTIMNVLLFSCVAGALPNVIFVISSGGMALDFAFEYFAMAEVIRALVGCIGIILAVPVSYIVNIAMRKRWAA